MSKAIKKTLKDAATIALLVVCFTGVAELAIVKWDPTACEVNDIKE